MITDCPHCLRRVLPRGDGTCPSCGKDPKNTNGVDPTRAVLVYRPGMKWPRICFNCTRPAVKLAECHLTNERPQNGIGWTLIKMFLPFGKTAAALDQERYIADFIIALPVCGACHEQGVKPKLQSYELQDFTAHVVVHRDFKAAVEADQRS